MITVPILSSLIGMADGWLQGRTKKSVAKAEAHAEVIKRAAQSDADWENIMAKGAMSSWKDEYWVIVLSIPMVLAFIPEMVPHLQAGFEVLATMPEWYQYSLMGAIGASFGLRGLTRITGR